MYMFFLILFSISTLLSCNHKSQDFPQLENDHPERIVTSNGFLSDVTNNLGKKTFQNVTFNSIPSEYAMIQDLDSLLSLYAFVQSKQQKVEILRQSLIAVNIKHVRTLDSLDYLSNADVIMLISRAFHVDIEQDPMELSKNEFNAIMKSLDSLLNIQSTHATIIRYINNEIFRYQWMHYTFTPIDNSLLKFEYNAGGMAGSAHADLYRKNNDEYSLVDLETLLKSIDKKLSRVVKEDAWVDINRFEMEINPSHNNNEYMIECYVQVYSGALCCPPYITRFKSKDFTSIIPGSLYYSASDHKSDPNIAPKWKRID
jgi:hypothetical protein